MGAIETDVYYDRERRRRRIWRRIERVDKETGEVITTEETEDVQYGQEKFVQIQARAFFELMKSISGNARLVFSLAMNEASRSTNVALITQASVTQKTGLSKPTVERCFVELQKADAIRKQTLGQWMLNPLYSVSCRRDYIPRLMLIYSSLPAWRDSKPIGELKNEEEHHAS